MNIKRFKVSISTEEYRDLLPLNSSEQLGGVYGFWGDAMVALENVYEDLRRYTCTDVHFDREEGDFTLVCLGIPVTGKIETIYIDLTAAEVRDAWTEQDNICKTEDCRVAVYAFAGYDPEEDDSDPDNLIAAQSFLDKYGLSICDLAEGAGEETDAIRKKIMARFDKIFDMNCDMNSTWAEAVREVLEELC